MIRSQDGYIAIISTILMFFVLTALTVTVSFVGFTHRMNVLEAEQKIQSSELASACVDQALIRIATNRDYGGGDTLTLNSQSCTITAISPSSLGSNRVIRTTSSVGNAVTTLRVEIVLKDFSIISWEEVP